MTEIQTDIEAIKPMIERINALTQDVEFLKDQVPVIQRNFDNHDQHFEVVYRKLGMETAGDRRVSAAEADAAINGTPAVEPDLAARVQTELDGFSRHVDGVIRDVEHLSARLKGLDEKTAKHGVALSDLRSGQARVKEQFARTRQNMNNIAKAVFPRLDALMAWKEIQDPLILELSEASLRAEIEGGQQISDLKARHCMLDAEVKHHTHELTPALVGRTGMPVFAFVDTNPEADYIIDTRDFDDDDVPAAPPQDDGPGEDDLWEQVGNQIVNARTSQVERVKQVIAKAIELGLASISVDPEDMDLHAEVQAILDQQVWSDLKSADELTTEVLATVAEWQAKGAKTP